MKYKVIETASGNEVKPGMNLLDFRKEIWKFEGCNHPTKIQVSHPESKWEREFFPSVFDCTIVEDKDD